MIKFIGIVIWMILLLGRLQAQYCSPEYVNACTSTGSYINKFTLHDLVNSASGCNGNADNYIVYPSSSFTTSLQLGGVYEFSMKSGSGTGSTQGFAIWIDYNNDEDFEDNDELVYTSPSASSQQFSGTITVPFENDYTGQRRLRVRSAKQALLYKDDACAEFENGETEDYFITILEAPDCTGLPGTGTVRAFPSAHCAAGSSSELELSGVEAASGITYQWEKSADGSDWEEIDDAEYPDFLTEPLFSSTYFRVRIACAYSGQWVFSDTVMINVGTVELLSVTGDTLCGSGTAHLQAQGTGQQILWYEQPQGGIPVWTSTSIADFFPEIDTSSTFYVSAASGILYIEELGLKDSTGSNGSDAYKNGFLKFDVEHSCELVGVHVYPSASGFVYLQLRDAYFNVLHSDTFFITASQLDSAVFLELNLFLQPGDDYQLFLQEASIPLWSTHSSVEFPYEIPGVLSIHESNLGAGYYFYFYNWLINSSQLCETARIPVSALVEEPPSLEVLAFPGSAALCSGGDSVTLTASGSFPSYSWSPSSGLNATAGSSVKASPAATTTYTLSASDSVCTAQATVTVTLLNTPAVSALAESESICGGTSVGLNVSVTPLLNYRIHPVPFSPSGGAGNMVMLQDEDLSDGLPIGFDFDFYENTYTTFYISSNGYITFDSMDIFSCCTGQLIPNIATPNNLIAFAWEDLAPDFGGTISYFTEGVAPDRRLVVRIDSVNHFSFSGGVDPVTVQVMLYEAGYHIEIHTTAMPGNPNGNWFFHTQGIENAEGTSALEVPGRNASNTWTAYHDAWRFSPQQYSYEWEPASSLDNVHVPSPVASPLISTVYTVTVTDTATGCSAGDSVFIAVIQIPAAGLIEPYYQVLCESDTIQLSLNGFTEGASLQWQESSVENGPFLDIPGAEADTYDAGLIDETMYYRVIATCIETATSPVSKAEVVQVPGPPAAADLSRCSPGKAELYAQGSGDILSWYDAETGGNYIFTGDTFTTPSLEQSTTYWVEEGPPPASFISTTFSGGVWSAGNMFDITASHSLTIASLDVHLQASQSDLEVYYKPGSHIGFEQDPSAWILVGSIQDFEGAGPGIPTPFPLELNLVLEKGDTLALYVTATSDVINSTPGDATGAGFAGDGYMSIHQGSAMGYPFGTMVSPHKWNGGIHYQLTGCSGPRIPVQVLIYYPEIQAVASEPELCEDDTVSLLALNTGNGIFQYQWYPLLPVMFPADGTGDTVQTVPSLSTLFTLIATEQNNQCDTIIELNVLVNPVPTASFSGLPDTLEINQPAVLLSGFPSGGIFSGPGIIDNMFFDPAIAGAGGPYAITYTFTNIFGCLDDTVHYVTVLLASGLFADRTLRFSCYPNPADGIVQLTLAADPGLTWMEMDIVTPLGHPVFHQQIPPGAESVNWDVSDWPSGTYFIRIHSDRSTGTSRLVVQ